MKIGLSGALTRAFITSPLTPLFLIGSLIVGMIALIALPREEEPQISVPMVDIIVSTKGYKADEAVELITKPLEDIVKGIDGVEHTYSTTQDDQVLVTARFLVGTDQDTALLRVHEKIRSNIADLPYGIPEPLIIGHGINDVAILALTLTPKPEAAGRWNDNGLRQIAQELQHELMKVDNVGITYLIGGSPNQIRVEPDPERLALYGITLNQLVDKLQNANRSLVVGRVMGENRSSTVVAGQTLQGVPDIGLLLLTSRDGRPVYVKDVADVVVGAAETDSRAWNLAKTEKGDLRRLPAVTIAFAKRKGANAVVVASDLLSRLETIKGRLLPNDVEVAVTRNYGATATEKADELLFHLGLATVSIVALITWAIGWREGLVVLVVIPTTILLTLFASWLMGYTINRVSLFALIFSIGILVDDAIVIVENIIRHWHMRGEKGLIESAVEAVAEVGNPTIVATLTIIVALLPMMFVSGMMGPYMSPIPANASMAMIFSFFVAVIITPWLLFHIARHRFEGEGALSHQGGHEDAGALARLYVRIARPLLTGRRNSKRLLIGVGVATFAVCLLFVTRDVAVKLLPFDNKSELQVVLDMPQGTTLEDTQRFLFAAADKLKTMPELTSIQLYAGTSAPFNFNGLVRHYYLRSGPQQGDLQVNFVAKGERSRSSHELAVAVRKELATIAWPEGAVLRVVEVPPGPPVLATLLAEIYGPDQKTRRAAARKVEEAFRSVDFIHDVDDTFYKPAERLRFIIDQDNLEFHGVEQQAVYDTIATIIGGAEIGFSQRGHGAKPYDIVVKLPRSAQSMGERLLTTPIPAGGTTREGRNVELGDVVSVKSEPGSYSVYRRDGHAAEMVLAEVAGRFEAPIYGMFAVENAIKKMDWGKDGPPVIGYHGQPADESHVTLLWDGEWEVTYVTFRDMGAAFGVAILGIYLLVVAQFGSFKLPLVILIPVPLTLIGIVLGHWLFSAPFTATSMIGFIALAGIIVRNSILLVDFIRHRRAEGAVLRDALLEAGAIRFKPIVLTAAAAIIGAVFIIADPIFQGLAISLVFGLASSTALTLLVIPAVYVVLRDDHKDFEH
ncbi:AcrB/AcrD/AcrF family protein [Parvibaculum sedimenti]|uniref:AcrB/AcrD/AcrF family protein n=1 Tax=Parvibaculum sedimenti TaxID=2608632 RepID=A0A6N6VK94_9HYPH|nr:efflux RND transporter permease subunit [Parvibaculum sedimenti]KAB7739717.1 AcrB/AcrD/AcrF family protein [Parvibaculum sedimenti]